MGGWITTALVRRGHDVVVLGHSRGDCDPAAMFMAGDFRDPVAVREALRGCDSIVDVGAYYPLYSIHRSDQVARALADLQVVLTAAREARIVSMVFTSTLSVMSRDPHATRHSTYHAVKRAMHDMVLAAADEGLPVSIAVPGACFGPRDRKPTTGRVIVELCNGRLQFIIEGKMNAVDVRDVADAIAIMLERATPGSVYQLGKWNCFYSEFARRVAEFAGMAPPHIHVPYGPAKLAAIAVEYVQSAAHAATPLLPQSGLDLVHFGAFLDSGAARRELGFAPRSIDCTIIETILWFRAHGYIRRPDDTSPLPETTPHAGAAHHG